MRLVICIVLVSGIHSCAPGSYGYTVSMKESLSRDTMYYENDTLSLQFRFYPMGLEMAVKNKSADDITVNWDECKINVNGRDKEIEHAQIQRNKIYLTKIPSLLTAKSFCSDLIVYKENIYTEKRLKEKKMYIKHMYPTVSNSEARKVVPNLKGQVVTLFFSTQIKNINRDWVFNFSLDKIRHYPSLEWAWYSSGRNFTPVFQSK